MTTETSLTILVVILSITLIIFLISGIILLVKIIQVANIVKRITLKAEDIADKAEAVTEFFEKGSAIATFTKLVSNITDVVNRKKK